MIVAWSPFMGGPRLPSLLLAMIGVWLIATQRQQLFDSRAMRRWLWVFGLLWLPALLFAALIGGLLAAYRLRPHGDARPRRRANN